MISREKVYELVEVFYQPTFKTFYINSVDGVNFVKPVGVFVSLGITTSRKVLEDIKDTILGTGKYNAVVAEISSKKVGSQYLNTIISTSPEQYLILDPIDGVMNRDESINKLDSLKNKMSLISSNQDIDVIKTIAPKISKLQDLIDKLDNSSGWDSHLIQECDDDFRIYHKNINYKKEGDLEFRIGIYVSEIN